VFLSLPFCYFHFSIREHHLPWHSRNWVILSQCFIKTNLDQHICECTMTIKDLSVKHNCLNKNKKTKNKKTRKVLWRCKCQLNDVTERKLSSSTPTAWNRGTVIKMSMCNYEWVCLMCSESTICSLFSENCAVQKVSISLPPVLLSVCCRNVYDFAGNMFQFCKLTSPQIFCFFCFIKRYKD